MSNPSVDLQFKPSDRKRRPVTVGPIPSTDFDDLVYRACFDNSAVFHDDNLIGQGVNHFQIV